MIAAALGWVGTVGTFVAYLAVSRGWLAGHSWRYATLNAVGGMLGGIAATLYGAWPSAASNFIWAAIGVGTLTDIVRRRRDRRVCATQAPSGPPALESCAGLAS